MECKKKILVFISMLFLWGAKHTSCMKRSASWPPNSNQTQPLEKKNKPNKKIPLELLPSTFWNTYEAFKEKMKNQCYNTLEAKFQEDEAITQLVKKLANSGQVSQEALNCLLEKHKELNPDDKRIVLTCLNSDLQHATYEIIQGWLADNDLVETVDINLDFLDYCKCDNAPIAQRILLVKKILNRAKELRKKQFVYTSFGSGGLLQDYFALRVLRDNGFDPTINIIDLDYQMINKEKSLPTVKKFAQLLNKQTLLYTCDYHCELGHINIFTCAQDYIKACQDDQSIKSNVLTMIDPAPFFFCSKSENTNLTDSQLKFNPSTEELCDHANKMNAIFKEANPCHKQSPQVMFGYLIKHTLSDHGNAYFLGNKFFEPLNKGIKNVTLKDYTLAFKRINHPPL